MKTPQNHTPHLRGLLALSPIAVLLVVYLVGSLIAGDFYRIPISVAFIITAIYGVLTLRGKSLEERVDVFSAGAANPDIMYMVWIFCLAGIFASSAKAMGAVDATVALTLKAIPGEYLPAGIFLATCFISMAIGTSVGTIVALTPVVTAIAPQIGCSVGWLVAAVVGGAFFGDNLSFISDTTIAATQSQGCKMRDKFRTNFMIVLPVALLTLGVYLWGSSTSLYTADTLPAAEWYKALPYLLVIILALTGVNVLIVLITGIITTDIIGIASGSFSGIDILTSAGAGLGSMCELILVTLLAGGVMNIVKQAGGFDYLIEVLTARISSRRGAEGVVALLTALTNLCTANNTIAILTTGSISRDLSSRYAIPPRKTASIMDIASCVIQGIIPYGAQLLMAAGLASISPMEIIPHLYYPMFLGGALLLSIILQYPRR